MSKAILEQAPHAPRVIGEDEIAAVSGASWYSYGFYIRAPSHTNANLKPDQDVALALSDAIAQD